jgi:Transposase
VDEEFLLFVGIDWATEAHQVCIVDRKLRVVGERIVDHNRPAIAAFAEWLTEIAEGEAVAVAVAIEIPRGAVVETLASAASRYMPLL